MKGTPYRRLLTVVVRVLTVSIVVCLSACVSEYPLTAPREGASGSSPAPTGAALFAEARENFVESRAELSTFLTEFETGPWEVSHYGDYPVACGSGHNAGYYFEISRTINRPDLDMDDYVQRSVEALSAAGFATRVAQYSEEEMHVRSERETGPLHDVYVGVMSNGSFFVKANSVCFPGDISELIGLMTKNHTVKLRAIAIDAPSDPAQFGLPE